MLIEREEVAGPDYYPTDPDLQKWAHEEGSLYLGDQKVKVKGLRLLHAEQGGGDSPVLCPVARPRGIL
jgi:hypothetical protein